MHPALDGLTDAASAPSTNCTTLPPRLDVVLSMVNSNIVEKVLSSISLSEFKTQLFNPWILSLPPTRIGSSLLC